MAEDAMQLRYDLFSLPTAQHKAGLAGLCVLIDTLQRRKIGPLPELAFPEQGIIELTLTKETLATLFNDLYDAAYVETAVTSKWADATLLREEVRQDTDPKTGKIKNTKLFIYNRVEPKAAFLDALQAPDVWLKLWRDAVWTTLRGKPTTRTPYNERADGKPVNEVETTWKELQKLKKNSLTTAEVASSLFVGAQAVNAEKVPFKGRVDENLLLHFWQLVMRVFVPEVVNREGKGEFKGYVLAIPEVSDVEGFAEEFRDMTAQLKSDLKGYRPAESVISVPQEGALEYIAALVRSHAQDGDIAYNLASVEIVHLEKRGNNIAMLSSGRLPVDDAVRSKYESIRGHYGHPLFRLQLIRNLLDGREWYEGFDRLLSPRNKDWFIGRGSWFPVDVRNHFKIINQ